MSKADKTFTRTEIAALKACIGRELGSVDAVFVAREDLAWNTVRLHLDGLALDIDCRLGDVEVDEFGTLEEFGLVSVAEAADERLCMPDVSADTTVLDVGELGGRPRGRIQAPTTSTRPSWFACRREYLLEDLMGSSAALLPKTFV